MRLLTGLLAIVPFTHGLLNVPYNPTFLPFSSPQVIIDTIWPPPIPQLILDTDHPWLVENKAWLSRYPNVRDALCSKESHLWTTPESPEHTLPSDLFANVNIDNNKYGVDRPGWKNARDRLRELKKCPAVLGDVNTLHIDIHIHSYKSSPSFEPPSPPEELPHLFADVVPKMSNLETLRWGIGPESSSRFEAAFAAANATLPSVKHMVPAAYTEWLVRRCPNLESLHAGSFHGHASWNHPPDRPEHDYNPLPALISATKGLPLRKMHVFAYGRANPLMKQLETILATVPNIASLELDGELLRKGPSLDADPGVLQRHLDFLARFPNLTSLHLPPASELGLEFDGGPFCGNAYDGAGGRAYGRQVAREGAEAVGKAGNMTIKTLPHLLHLGIGHQAANITRSGEGQVQLVWPWTGRMKAYAYEIWPEYGDGEMEGELWDAKRETTDFWEGERDVDSIGYDVYDDDV